MSDTLEPAPDAPRDRSRSAVWAALLLLAVALVALSAWQSERIAGLRHELAALRDAPIPAPTMPAEAAQALAALQGDVNRLQAQVAALGKRAAAPSAPAAPDLAPALAALSQRVDQLAAAQAAPPTPSTPAPTPAAAPPAPPVDLGPLRAALDQLRDQVAKLPPPPDLGPLSQRLDALDGRLNSVQAAAQSADSTA